MGKLQKDLINTHESPHAWRQQFSGHLMWRSAGSQELLSGKRQQATWRKKEHKEKEHQESNSEKETTDEQKKDKHPPSPQIMITRTIALCLAGVQIRIWTFSLPTKKVDCESWISVFVHLEILVFPKRLGYPGAAEQKCAIPRLEIATIVIWHFVQLHQIPVKDRHYAWFLAAFGLSI